VTPTRSSFCAASTTTPRPSLGWLPTQGAERHRRFLKSDSKARLKADDDCRKVGEPILTDEKRAEYERHLKELPAEMPGLADRAAQADDHWTGRFEGLRGADTTHSYSGLYAIAYRRHSALDHASLMGLNPVIVDLDDGTNESSSRSATPRSMASMVWLGSSSPSACSQRPRHPAGPRPKRFTSL
jgi:hypothetical protein